MKDLSSIENDMSDTESECNRIRQRFKEISGLEAEVCVIVPGRVNIIGEHVDYSGFAVLPMALERNIMVAAALKHTTSGDSLTLRLANIDPAYPQLCRPLTTPLSIDYEKEGWGSYFVCGLRGALEVRSEHSTLPPGEIVVVVSGTVPPNAGLSSSSALVCAAFLTTVNLLKMDVSMPEAATRCASSERYIGTEGGGMDQAIALLASPGCAKLVEFEPKLKATDVCLPGDAIFVVAHSQATKNKAASSDFNTRVVECRIAAQILGKRSGLEWKKIKKLKHVLDELNLSLDDAAAMVTQHLTRPYYSKQQICDELEVSPTELESLSLSSNTKHIDKFKLNQRALHVFKEAGRVYEWHNAAKKGDLTALGKLMCESHASLKELYECSHDRVDLLVETCMSAGALGARITGAGWGGCVVALTTTSHVDEFIKKVKNLYYPDSPCDHLIFPTQPAAGARVFRL